VFPVIFLHENVRLFQLAGDLALVLGMIADVKSIMFDCNRSCNQISQKITWQRNIGVLSPKGQVQLIQNRTSTKK
jgi:hypothetical protein